MNENAQPKRADIAVRFLFAILFLLVFELIRLVLQVVVLFQFIHALVTTEPNEPVRRFSSRLTEYTQSVMRYMTLNQNAKPFPFEDFPEAVPPQEEVRF
ncbi:MAG: DUF4389 domain-containing protein [Desulfatibacillaceae bacterium]